MTLIMINIDKNYPTFCKFDPICNTIDLLAKLKCIGNHKVKCDSEKITEVKTKDGTYSMSFESVTTKILDHKDIELIYEKITKKTEKGIDESTKELRNFDKTRVIVEQRVNSNSI
ncbi:hypothetical protein MKS88_003497 [Plasmodium brasilianum]|uniref:Uncharacterized protein n=1 Tax=Plasmodium brasilianum TaxID=5824 RepID=A0ACB9Y5R0_PLABR|nr:hypothetical protein MKS88_003497 [Plasmodium brasilianum]